MHQSPEAGLRSALVLIERPDAAEAVPALVAFLDEHEVERAVVLGTQNALSGRAPGKGLEGHELGNEIAESAQHGLLILGGAGGRFAENVIRDNAGHGVLLGAGQEAELDDNELTGNRSPQERRIGN